MIYDDYTTKILASNPPVLEANRCDSTGLWKLPLEDTTKETSINSPTNESINAIFDLKSACQTFLWHHASAGFPVKESFVKAVRNGNYATWPKLTVTLINKHMPDSDKTTKGHLKGKRQGIRSTKHNAFTALAETEETRIKIKGESSLLKPLPPTKFTNIFVRIVDLTDEIHTYQTGAFPHTSQRGNRYIMVAIHLDENYIFAEPMKNRTEGEMIRVHQKIINRMKAAGLGLKKQVLDNECSAPMKASIQGNGTTYELVPPGQYRRNQAERAIQTFKSHFIFILAGVNNEFPLSLWCHLLEPAELTLNLLCQSRVTPNVSAFAHVQGNHDYMRKLFAPIGCAVGTQDGGYLRKVPLPRIPLQQSTALTSYAAPLGNHDTSYLRVSRIPTWSDLARSHLGALRSSILPIAPRWLM